MHYHLTNMKEIIKKKKTQDCKKIELGPV